MVYSHQPEQYQHTYEVVFVRHGQSTWNKANRFIGWTDTELTEEGEIEARIAGQVSTPLRVALISNLAPISRA